MKSAARDTILWIHPGGLLPVGGGGAARTWALIAHLRALGYAVELLTGDQGVHNDELAARVDRLWIPPGAGQEARSNSFLHWGKERLKGWYRRADPELRLYRRIAGRVPLPAAHEINVLLRNRRPPLERFAGEVAYARRPLAAIASYAWLAPALDHMPPGTLRLLDTIDIQHTRRETASAAGGDLDHLACSVKEEIRAWRRADVLLAIQAEDGAALEALCPEREIVVAEHAHRVPLFGPSKDDAAGLLYVGNRYDPNVLGLHTLLAGVWPAVRKACPSATLTVCGRVCEAVRGTYPGVAFLGQVPDLAPHYEAAALVLNPVPYGTGLKIKTVEALAHGRCVVCTEAGTGGLGDPAGLPLIVAEDPAAMAAAVITLLQAPEERHALEKRAWDFARERFAPARVYGDLAKRLEAQRGFGRNQKT